MGDYKLSEKCCQRCCHCGKVAESDKTLHKISITENFDICFRPIDRMVLCDDCEKKLTDMLNDFKAEVKS